MHSIKKAARRAAWYSEEDEKQFIPNPYRRPRPKRQVDEENRPYRTVSETVAGSPAEDARRRNYEEAQLGSQGPRKSGTYPLGPQGNMPHVLNASSPSDEGKDSMSRSGPADDLPRDKEADNFVDRSIGGGAPDDGPRNRKLLPWKKKHHHGGGGGGSTDHTNTERTERTDTSDSLKKNHPKITIMSQLRVVLFSWINILLVAVPAGIALGNTNVNGVVVFVVNFIAIIPLAGMLSFATEELAMYIGETLGGLLNATFGNAVELIVGVIALTKGEILIVQTSLIGSMLSNLLLVLGMCFFFGGLRRDEQHFNLTVAQTGASLLALAIGSLIIPTAFAMFATGQKGQHGVAPVSRGTSVLLLFTYACYLVFQLRTHVDKYNEPSQKTPKKKSKHQGSRKSRVMAFVGANNAAAAANDQARLRMEERSRQEADGAGDEEIPQLTRAGALITLAASTVLVAVCAEYMVGGITAVSQSVSQEFIGLILLPIVGNAAEHATAVTVAIKDKMDLAIGVAIGSSLQIALLVLPLMVLINWFGVPGHGQAMTLHFDGFLVSVLFIAIILVNYVIQDGKSHWLEGALLQVTYLIIAVSAWFYPAKGNVAG